jgi:predicted neuraminidase
MKQYVLLLSVLFVLVVPMKGEAVDDPALEPVKVNTSPGPEYGDDARAFQGIPGLERTEEGRLWATWYAGGPGEGPENYAVLVTSGDDGNTWSGPELVIDPPGRVRAFDPCLWVDPTGKLWLFWAQAFHFWDGRAGVWCITTENPENAKPDWTAPRRIADGIMMNKPTVLSSGEWLFPIAVWLLKPKKEIGEYAHDLGDAKASSLYVSTDQGKTITLRSHAYIPERGCDEHMFVEKKNGDVQVLVRAAYGIGESTSSDKGKTWSEGKKSTIPHIPHARFFIRRLDSGNLLLVNHNPPDGKTRSHLTAWLSEDDGASWKGGLVLDERKYVSYPDGVQAPDGRIYIIHDRERTGAREILMSVFREEDVLARKAVSDDARFRVLVNKAGD